ncbi:hypothetical protein GCM10009639_13450 [Kitasatospora putterlickiae]|uniref:Uncharacterized protein n=1 Tax=Kitasatospora putterlickiae TaxID=221725 RepID=A0ABN1XRD6_9ACTN
MAPTTVPAPTVSTPSLQTTLAPAHSTAPSSTTTRRIALRSCGTQGSARPTVTPLYSVTPAPSVVYGCSTVPKPRWNTMRPGPISAAAGTSIPYNASASWTRRPRRR